MLMYIGIPFTDDIGMVTATKLVALSFITSPITTDVQELPLMAPILNSVTAACHNIAEPVYLHATDASHALWSSVVPIPPLLTLTTVAQGDLVRPVQLHSTVELHHQRRVIDVAGNNEVGQARPTPRP